MTKELLSKENGKLLSNPELREPLLDLATAMLDLNIVKPEEITLEQQQLLAVINHYFSEHIKEHLPNYDRTIPKLDQYITMLNELPNLATENVPGQVGSRELQDFARNPDMYFMGEIPAYQEYL